MKADAHSEADDASPSPPPRPAPSTSIRAATPKPQRLSRKTLMAGTLVLGSAIAFALMSGLADRPTHSGADPDSPQTAQIANPPEIIRQAPASYDQIQLQPPVQEGRDYFWGDDAPEAAGNDDLAPPPPTGHVQPPAVAAQTTDPTEVEADTARSSSILFARGHAAGARPSTAASASASGPHGAFMNAQSARDDGVLEASYQSPRSPYIVQSGSTIPAALITALNSDQPGRAIAQVSENVFDSVTGAQLLIPQGARLIGAYDADTTYGEQRLLVVWNRLIMPNGWSIALRGMPGADASGAAGLHGGVDAHLGRIAVASLISGALSVAANESEDDDSSRLMQSVGDAAAQQAAQTGARIIDRELNVRPTLRIRAGARVRVLVSQDIVLRPYRP